MGIRKIIKLFEDGNVCVTGLRGRGKDMLMANVVCRRNKRYVSNVEYDQAHHIEYLTSDFECGGNTYKDFISGSVKHYIYPHGDGVDLYLSDVGIYFPSQYCNELNRDYKQIPTFMALSRQLAECNVHINVQNLNRAWDKLREQSDAYITCIWCKVFFGIVFQKVIYYDKYSSCEQRVKPFTVPLSMLANSQTKTMVNIEKEKFRQTYGEVKPMLLIYRNKSKYDTRIFKQKLENGSQSV